MAWFLGGSVPGLRREAGISLDIPQTSLTFQVTWMLCDVTGCKVTSMGGPSGAGGVGEGRNDTVSQVLEEKSPGASLHPPEQEDH